MIGLLPELPVWSLSTKTKLLLGIDGRDENARLRTPKFQTFHVGRVIHTAQSLSLPYQVGGCAILRSRQDTVAIMETLPIFGFG